MRLPTELQMQKVLDHGYVKFIDSMGTDETVIKAARMSTGRGFERWDKGFVCKLCRMPLENANTNTGGCEDPASPGFILEFGSHVPIEVPGDTKLLEYLFSNGHTTPFEMCELHVEVCAPILTFRQWHRHRTMSYNEQSARYGPLPDLFYVPDEARIAGSFKASANKQASGKGEGPAAPMIYAATIEVEQKNNRLAYVARLDDGMAPELARLNVPVSQYSKCRVKTDLHNWLGFLRLRMHEHAQYEIRVFAEAVGKIVAALYPRTWALFEEYTLGAVRFSKTEAECLKGLFDALRAPYGTAPMVMIARMPFGPLETPARRAAFLKKLGIEG